MEDDLQNYLNGRRPQFIHRWKTTSIFIQIEDDLYFLTQRRRSQFCTKQIQHSKSQLNLSLAQLCPGLFFSNLRMSFSRFPQYNITIQGRARRFLQLQLPDAEQFPLCNANAWVLAPLSLMLNSSVSSDNIYHL